METAATGDKLASGCLHVGVCMLECMYVEMYVGIYVGM